MQQKYSPENILELLSDNEKTPQERMEQVEAIIRQDDFDVNAYDSNGLTLLHHAILQNVPYGVLKYVMRNLQADPNLPVGGNFRHNGDMSLLPVRPGLSPLHLGIATSASLTAIAALIQHGAEVNAYDLEDNAPMDMAVKPLTTVVQDTQKINTYLSIIKLLHACGGVLHAQREAFRENTNLRHQIDSKNHDWDSITPLSDQLVAGTAHVQLSGKEWEKAFSAARNRKETLSSSAKKPHDTEAGPSSGDPSREAALLHARAIVAEKTIALLGDKSHTDQAFREAAEQRVNGQTGKPSKTSPEKEERRFAEKEKPTGSPLQTLRRRGSSILRALHHSSDGGEKEKGSRGK